MILSLLSIQSCGPKKSSEAQFVINLGAMTGSGDYPGGVIIYGHNSSGTQRFSRPITNVSYNIELENGEWSFYSLTWSGLSVFEGDLKCAHTVARLNGDPLTISLTPQIATCDSEKFSPPIFRENGLIQPLKFITCSDLSSHISDPTCSQSPGLHQSVEVVLNSYEGRTSIDKSQFGNSLKSKCINLNNGLSSTTLKVPMGSPFLDISAEIHAYVGPNCSRASKNVFHFPRGLLQRNLTNALVLDDPGSSGADEYTKIFLKSEFNFTYPSLTYNSYVGLSTSNINIRPTLNNGGSPVSSCSAPNLPLGLSIDSKTCVISGISSDMLRPESYSVTMTTEAGFVLTSEVSITVNTGNTSPTLNSISDVSINEDIPVSVPYSFSDEDSSPNCTSSITVTSSNTTLVPNAKITKSGTAPTCSLSISPALNQNGTSTITVVVSDGALTDTKTFTLTVNPVNNAPVLSVISNQTTTGTSPRIVTLNVSDLDDTINCSTSITATSSNQTFLPASNIITGGTAPSCTLTLTPVALANMTATTTVTVTASDGDLFATQSFTLTATASSTPLANPILAGSTPVSPSNVRSFNLSFSGTFSVGTALTVYGDQNCSQSFGSTTVTIATATVSGFSPVPLLVTIPMDGSHNLHVKQTDTNGNFSNCHPIATYILDTTSPQMPVIYGVKGPSTSSDNNWGNQLTSGHIPKIGWSVISDAVSYSADIKYDSTNTSACSSVTIQSSQFQGDYLFEKCPLREGIPYTVQVKAFDQAGNVSVSTNYQFQVLYPLWMPLANNSAPLKNHDAFWINGSGSGTSGSGYTGMFIWGGENLNGLSIDSFNYNPNNHYWFNLNSTNPPAPRTDHTAIWTGGGMLIWGGTNGTASLADGHFWNMATYQWSQIPSSTIPRSGHAAFWQKISGSQRMVVFGGRTGNSPSTATLLNTIEVYEPTNSSWSTLQTQGSPPILREKMAYAYFENEKKFFIWGGSNFLALGDGWVLDFNQNPAMWTSISTTNAPSSRTEMSFTSFNDGDPKVVIWGGQINGTKLNTGYIYNLRTNSWSPMTTTNAPSARTGAKMVWTGNEIMVWGGKVNGIATDTGAFYNVESDSWLGTSLQNSPEPRFGHSMVLDPVNKDVYIFGGEDQNGSPLQSLFKIKP